MSDDDILTRLPPDSGARSRFAPSKVSRLMPSPTATLNQPTRAGNSSTISPTCGSGPCHDQRHPPRS